jgi:hypothetical protein
MDWKLPLGILIGLATGIAANLLTPFAKPTWAILRHWTARGYQAQLRNELRLLKVKHDQLLRLSTLSPKDFLVYLFQWLLITLSLFMIGVAIAFLTFTAVNISPLAQKRMVLASLSGFICSITVAIMMMANLRSLTTVRAEKRLAQLTKQMADLATKLK